MLAVPTPACDVAGCAGGGEGGARPRVGDVGRVQHCERLHRALRAVVQDVVVREAHTVDMSRPQRLHAPLGLHLEVERLLPRPLDGVAREGALEVQDADVRGGEGAQSVAPHLDMGLLRPARARG